MRATCVSPDQPSGTPPQAHICPPDRLTILRTKGLPATKTIGLGPDGRLAVLASYGNAKRFAIRQVPVDGLASLAAALDRIRADELVIRGEPLEGVDRRECVRRLHRDPVTGEPATFREVPRRWLLLDFDTVTAPDWLDPTAPEDAAAYLRSRLPDDFHASSFWWAYTSSAGIKPGEQRMRLAFWLDRPVGKAYLGRWLKAAQVDATVFRTVQAIYVARPILKSVTDPVPRRSGIFVDVDDMVPVPELPAEAPKAQPRPMHTPSGRRIVLDVTKPEAEDLLGRLCGAVRRGTKGNRHRLLMWAAARAVELEKEIPRETIADRLIRAANKAGLDEPDAEVERQIRNGFKIGVFGTGAAA